MINKLIDCFVDELVKSMASDKFSVGKIRREKKNN